MATTSDDLDPQVTAASPAELAAEEAGHVKVDLRKMTDAELTHTVDELPDDGDDE